MKAVVSQRFWDAARAYGFVIADILGRETDGEISLHDICLPDPEKILKVSCTDDF